LGLIAARRARTTFRAPTVAHLVAITHSNNIIDFYSVPATAGLSPRFEAPRIEPTAQHVCNPKNIRFGNNVYPVRDYHWVSYQSSSEPTVICVLTEICVDVVAIDSQDSNKIATSLLRRYPTRVDFFTFHFQSGVLVLINRVKPAIVKSFLFPMCFIKGRITTREPVQFLVAAHEGIEGVSS